MPILVVVGSPVSHLSLKFDVGRWTPARDLSELDVERFLFLLSGANNATAARSPGHAAPRRGAFSARVAPTVHFRAALSRYASACASASPHVLRDAPQAQLS